MKYIPPLLSFILLLSGCTTIVDATTKQPINTDPNQRSFGTYIDDKRLQVITAVNIRKADPILRQSHIGVTSFNNVILLTGQVPNEDLRLLAAKSAKAISTVRQVHNEIRVKANTSMLTRTNDAWLATKIKSVLIADKSVKSLRIKVTVEDGVAYLMGLVSQEEANRAVNLIRNIKGIKEVVKVFEYSALNELLEVGVEARVHQTDQR